MVLHSLGKETSFQEFKGTIGIDDPKSLPAQVIDAQSSCRSVHRQDWLVLCGVFQLGIVLSPSDGPVFLRLTFSLEIA